MRVNLVSNFIIDSSIAILQNIVIPVANLLLGEWGVWSFFFLDADNVIFLATLSFFLSFISIRNKRWLRLTFSLFVLGQLSFNRLQFVVISAQFFPLQPYSWYSWLHCTILHQIRNKVLRIFGLASGFPTRTFVFKGLYFLLRHALAFFEFVKRFLNVTTGHVHSR